MIAEDIRIMPLNQMKIILKLHDSPGKRNFAEGKSEGGTVKELLKKNYVEPAGKQDRRIRWQLVESKFSKQDIALMRELVK